MAPLAALFHQLDTSTVEGDPTLDLAAGLARLTSWMNESGADEADNVTLGHAFVRSWNRESTHKGTVALKDVPPPASPKSNSPEPNTEHDEAYADPWRLVAAAKGGDKVAFGELYNRYVDVVFRYVLFRVGDRELAEDVTSETFLRALRRITSVSYQGRDVGAWFVTIARNLVLDHAKSNRHRLEVSTQDIRDTERVEASPEQQVMSKLTHEALLAYVSQLGEDQRDCIILRFLQGRSVSETAVIMNRNEGAVKAMQHKAVRRLAQLLPMKLR